MNLTVNHQNREIRFIEAVLGHDQRELNDYFEYAYEKIVPVMIRKFAAQFEPEIIIFAFNDAFVSVGEGYIRSEICQVVNQKIEGLTSNSFTALMHTICYNDLKKQAVKQRKQREDSLESLIRQILYDGTGENEPTEQEKRIMERRAYKALLRLRPFCQQVIRLRRFNGFSYRQIKKTIGGTIGSLRGQVLRCLKQLRVEYRKIANTAVGTNLTN